MIVELVTRSMREPPRSEDGESDRDDGQHEEPSARAEREPLDQAAPGGKWQLDSRKRPDIGRVKDAIDRLPRVRFGRCWTGRFRGSGLG